MLSKRMLVQIVVLVAALVIGILIGPSVVSSLSGVAQSAEALALPAQEVEPAAPAASTCSIREVAVFNTRIHVRCFYGSDPGGAIIYFAAPTSDTQRAARLLSTMLTAHASGKRLYVAYDTAASGAAYGCATANCRPIDYLIMLD